MSEGTGRLQLRPNLLIGLKGAGVSISLGGWRFEFDSEKVDDVSEVAKAPPPEEFEADVRLHRWKW